MTTPTSPIPRIYHILFTWIDPVMATCAIYLDLFAPAFVVDGINPDVPYNPAHAGLFCQLSAPMATTLFLQVFLLRYTNDVGVWKIFQAAILVGDIFVIAGQLQALGTQGRLSVSGCRPEDWGLFGIMGSISLVRLLFVVGFGFEKKDGKAKKA